SVKRSDRARDDRVHLALPVSGGGVALCRQRRDLLDIGEDGLTRRMESFGCRSATAAERRDVSPGYATTDPVRSLQTVEITALMELDLAEVPESGDPLLPQHGRPTDTVHRVVDRVPHRVRDHRAEGTGKGPGVFGHRVAHLPEDVPCQDPDTGSELFAEAGGQLREQLSRTAEFVSASALNVVGTCGCLRVRWGHVPLLPHNGTRLGKIHSKASTRERVGTGFGLRAGRRISDRPADRATRMRGTRRLCRRTT